MSAPDNAIKSMVVPQAARLKALGKGISVEHVLGNRVLVSTVIPYTDMDRLEEKGLLYIPETVKDKNTPLPSTGKVVALGEGVSKEDAALLTQGILPDGSLSYVGVLFSKFAGQDFMIQEESFKIIAVEEILCTLRFEDGVGEK